MKNKTFVSFLFICLVFNLNYGQQPSTEIYKQLEKLNFLGSALYIAAHPDDENTALISYLSNHVNAHTAYLSLTRGDGGQKIGFHRARPTCQGRCNPRDKHVDAGCRCHCGDHETP